MERYSKYSIEEFATDSSFIKWVLDADMETVLFWEEFRRNYPSQIQNMESAKVLVKSLIAVEPDIPPESIEKIGNKIFSHKKRIILFQRFGWAAIFVLILGASGIVYQLVNRPRVDFAAIEIPSGKKAEIIFADGTKKEISSNNSRIIQDKQGTVIVDSDTLKMGKKETETKDTRMVTVVMPYGKQTRLQLSDGSIIQINSGSKVSYPVEFIGSTREIYLSGEAYFIVKTNKQKSFIVHTADMDVRVTGTIFNVSAYSDDTFSQAVLVSGVVNVDRKNILKRNVKLQPGESLSLDKSTGEISKEFVNTEQYTSWINGYFICNKESVAGVIKKLERYYNCKINCENNISGITFSGKLDLKDNIKSVIDALSFASPMRIEINNEPI